MKYKVSVVKRITLLLMTMALAVALVACSGAAGTQGPPGPPGPPGQDAPTPEPTDPPAPTDPPDPPEPPGAAPQVTTMFPDVYLTLAGAGDKHRSFTLREHFADMDSLLKYTVTSSDAMIATAAVTDGVLKVTAKKDGSSTITVTAADDEGVSTAVDEFSVTVVKTNDAPTTHGLNQTDRSTKLEKRLYYRDGTQSYTITVVSDPGATTGAVAVTDSILADNFAVVIGEEKANSPGVDADPTDNKVTVEVMKVGTHSYTIDITPDDKGFGGKKSQMVKIYPKDMFRAQVKTPWEFTAMYNPPPKVLSKNFHLELKRDHDSDSDTNDPATVTAGASGAGATGGGTGNVGRVVISDFFMADSLERMIGTGAVTATEVDALDDATDANGRTTALAALNPLIDTVGDTECIVSSTSSSQAVVMPLSEAGAVRVTPGYDGTADSEAEVDHGIYIVDGKQALHAIRIDTRYKSLGDDKIQTDPPTDLATNPASYEMYQKNKDADADGTGTFTVMISCTDKDETATVTGTVVVRS